MQVSPDHVQQAMTTVEAAQNFAQSDTVSTLGTLGVGAIILIVAAVAWALFNQN